MKLHSHVVEHSITVCITKVAPKLGNVAFAVLGAVACKCRNAMLFLTRQLISA